MLGLADPAARGFVLCCPVGRRIAPRVPATCPSADLNSPRALLRSSRASVHPAVLGRPARRPGSLMGGLLLTFPIGPDCVRDRIRELLAIVRRPEPCFFDWIRNERRFEQHTRHFGTEQHVEPG
jgi:hypothetical protein